MADIPLDYARLQPRDETYDGRGYGEVGVELGELPRSHAPSYISNKTSLSRMNDDKATLITHDPVGSSPGSPSGDGIPEYTTARTATSRSNREKRRKLQGWRFGVAASTATATAVLTVNVVVTIAACAKVGLVGGIGTAYDGDCGTVNTWALWLHIIINVLSSILLSASNYTMQCVTSPTRKELDRAHSRGDWLDIGVAGVRNLSRISRQRQVLWVMLAFSSIPIHLLYNSAVFKTLNSNNYSLVVANPQFLQGGNFSTDFSGPNVYGTTIIEQQVLAIEAVQSKYVSNSSAWRRLDPIACMNAYGSAFISDYRDLMLITNDRGNSTNNTVFYVDSITYDSGSGTDLPYSWICLDAHPSHNYNYQCNIGEERKNATEWHVGGRKIDHCLAQPVEPHCKLQFSLGILIAVIVCNAVKSLAMFWTLRRQKDVTLVTIGDAIASYLDEPDELTKGRCLMGKVDVSHGPLRWTPRRKIMDEGNAFASMVATYTPNLWRLMAPGWKKPAYGSSTADDARPYLDPPALMYSAPMYRRWMHAVSWKRWVTTIGLCVTALCIAIYLLSQAVGAVITGTGNTISSLGFGAVDSRALLSLNLPTSGTSGLVSSVLIANLPQAIVSFLYLMYNGLYTCMHLAAEWSSYGIERKALRCTTPFGEQRSTYYLQLPYTYALPLIAASATLHWLISESIFLARIEVSGSSGSEEAVSSVGYSCAPIVCIIVLGSCMLMMAVGMGLRKFKSHMPVASSCSVAIAAACHRPEDDVDASVLPVKWGAVEENKSDEVGHCSFTSLDVGEMVVGKMYAGCREYVEWRNARFRGVR